MGSFPIQRLDLPALLNEIPDAPEHLTIRGVFPPEDHRFLAVVGARDYTPYGKAVCEDLIYGLREHKVVIVSGLALGIDGIAHHAALEAGLPTVAVPGSGLDDRVLYPRIHRRLADDILEAGGALVSEFEPLWKPRPESFPQRNRIMAGLSHATLVVEAAERSGTLITARLAADYNRDVLAVPGAIQNETAKGPHALLKRGAALITGSSDILHALGLDPEASQPTLFKGSLSEDECLLVELLEQPRAREELLADIAWSPSRANAIIASLELKGVVRERMGKLERATN